MRESLRVMPTVYRVSMVQKSKMLHFDNNHASIPIDNDDLVPRQ